MYHVAMWRLEWTTWEKLTCLQLLCGWPRIRILVFAHSFKLLAHGDTFIGTQETSHAYYQFYHLFRHVSSTFFMSLHEKRYFHERTRIICFFSFYHLFCVSRIFRRRLTFKASFFHSFGLSIHLCFGMASNPIGLVHSNGPLHAELLQREDALLQMIWDHPLQLKLWRSHASPLGLELPIEGMISMFPK